MLYCFPHSLEILRNSQIHDLMNIEPKTHKEGCLQDVHWFVGKFGYFPAYTLGHLMAAQFHEALKRDIQNLPELLQMGDFKPVDEWLRQKIHRRGRLMRTDELMQDITGSVLGTAPLIRHLEERYLGTA